MENTFDCDALHMTQTSKPSTYVEKKNASASVRRKSNEDQLRMDILMLTKRELELKIRNEYLKFKVMAVKEKCNANSSSTLDEYRSVTSVRSSSSYIV